MDISHYFEPVDFSVFSFDEKELCKYAFGKTIEKYDRSGTAKSIRKFNVALIGVPVDNGNWYGKAALAPDKIREQLYRLPYLSGDLKMVDLGNLRQCKNKKEVLLALRDVVDYLNELNIVNIVIGGSQDLTVGICEAYKNKKYFTLSVTDSVMDVKKGVEKFNSDNYLTRIFKSMPALFQFNMLAFQKHLIPSQFIQKAVGVNQHVRLGQLRENFSIVEPVLRNSDVLSFDIGAIKYTDAPGNKQQNPNGLRSEEACQLVKYAGLSSRIKTFGLFEVRPDIDNGELTSKLSAEIIWYFLEGFMNRQTEKKWSAENKVTYRVEIDQLDKPLVFFQDTVTERWWLEIKSLSGEKIIVACSEEEYTRASSNEIPEIWLNYIQKIDELSK